MTMIFGIKIIQVDNSIFPQIPSHCNLDKAQPSFVPQNSPHIGYHNEALRKRALKNLLRN